MRARFVRLFTKAAIAVAATSLALAGCGGGAHSSSPGLPAVSNPTQPSQGHKGTANFVMSVPAKSATAHVGPKYVSAATQSMTVSILQGSTPVVTQTVGLTPTSTGCTSSLASTTCTLALSLNAGSYTASINTYDGTAGAGNLLSSAQAVPFTVVANQANQVALTLNGVPAGIYVATAGKDKIYAEAQDADGNFIIGAGAPTFVAAKTSGTAVAAITQPTTANPNLITFALASPAPSAGTETIGVTATFPTGTNVCAQTGAVCSNATAVTATYSEGAAFLANYDYSNVIGYALPLASSTESPTYTVSGISSYPYGGIGADANGDVFVSAYSNPNTFAEIAPPYTSITAAQTGVTDETFGSIAAAPNGDVFVPSYGNSTMEIFTPPYTAAPTTISASVSSPYGAASDANSTIYLANTGNTTVTAYASPYTGTPVVVTTSSTPYAVFVSGNNLFVGESNGVDVFPLPLTAGEAPSATLSAPYVEYGLATDAGGNLWAGCYESCPDSNAGELFKFTTPFSTGETPAVKLPLPAPGFSSYDITGVGVDSAGNVYVENGYGGAQEGGLLEYQPPISSSSTPAVGVETTDMYYPWGMVITKPTLTVTP